MAIKFASDKERHEANLLRGFQLVVLCFSIVFLVILFGGWHSLFASSSAPVAIFGPLLLAFLAWGLGRYIGMSDGGVAKKIPLFALLLILSAAGVFNWMMITLEGKTVFLEAVSTSEDAFTKIQQSAKKSVVNGMLANKETDVKGKAQLFLSEVKNPLNCGYGPVARQRLAELMAVLPSLRLPSLPGTGSGLMTAEVCSSRAESFNGAIEQVWNSSEDGKNLEAIRAKLEGIVAVTDQSAAELSLLRQRAEDEGTSFILGEGRTKLESLNDTYKKQLAIVMSHSPDVELPRSLDLATIMRLGEWSQIVSVMASRLDHISTYVYLGLAVFIDFMLIYVFAEYRGLKMRQPRQMVTSNTGMRHLGSGDL